jgi:hypothetical protein
MQYFCFIKKNILKKKMENEKKKREQSGAMIP